MKLKASLRVVLSLCLLAIAIAVVDASASSKGGASAGQRDFIAYWAAGQQLVRGADPYDGPSILKLERAAGLDGNRPNLMLNTPLTLFMAWPLGLVSAQAGMMLWTMGMVASLMGSVRLLWILYGKREGRLHLLAYLFAPVLACLMAGQLGTFMLLGVVLFLYFNESMPMLAGAALVLCAVKPHLFLPFAMVILAWAISRKATGVLIGAAIALAGSCALSLLIDVHSWSQYLAMMQRTREVHEDFVPTVSAALRVLVDRDAVWIQFVPAAIACAWALWYFWTRRDRWSWTEQGLLTLLVSELCAPHAWFTDEVIVLPAILAALYREEDDGRPHWLFGALTGLALIEVMIPVQIISVFYLWTAPAWLGWYLYTTRVPRKKRSSAEGFAPKRLFAAGLDD